MPEYKAPITDFEFLLKDVFNISQYKEELDGFASLDDSFASAILSEGGKFCEEVLFPINQSGDKEGCSFSKGKVTMPKGFKEAYEAYCQAGWGGLVAEEKYGGQNLPQFLNVCLVEMMCSSNLAFGITPGLTHSAYNAITKFASEELKQEYLPKIVSGEYSAVMCLTEPQCGTDLGLIKTKAVPSKTKGKYLITGNKIFISAGDHDMTQNIVHLILAKLPDAPSGVKGISLFIVPKYKHKKDGTIGEENNVSCGSIEHKMGIHASPTCVMNYDNSEGYLIGEPHKGLRAMFAMMNEARLYVAIQGLGLSEVSYQNAAKYAKERLQGRALNGAKYPDKAADPLVVHPDIRRMLLRMRSFNEGARALTIFAALKSDISHRHKDEKAREEADDFIQVATPIMKAFFTDFGFDSTNLGMQIFGGHGYIKEYGMEQYSRDARIAQIYEGANGIQALDLVGRKLPKNTGKYLRRIFHPITEFVEKNRDNKELEEFNKPLYKILDSARKASLYVAMNGVANPDEAAAASTEYLRIMGHLLIGYMWCLIVESAYKKLNEADADKAFLNNKINLARFYLNKVAPEHYGLLAAIVSGSKSLMAIDDDMF